MQRSEGAIKTFPYRLGKDINKSYFIENGQNIAGGLTT